MTASHQNSVILSKRVSAPKDLPARGSDPWMDDHRSRRTVDTKARLPHA